MFYKIYEFGFANPFFLKDYLIIVNNLWAINGKVFYMGENMSLRLFIRQTYFIFIRFMSKGLTWIFIQRRFHLLHQSTEPNHLIGRKDRSLEQRTAVRRENFPV